MHLIIPAAISNLVSSFTQRNNGFQIKSNTLCAISDVAHFNQLAFSLATFFYGVCWCSCISEICTEELQHKIGIPKLPH